MCMCMKQRFKTAPPGRPARIVSLTARRCRSAPRPTLARAAPVPHPAAQAAGAMTAYGLAPCAPCYWKVHLRTVAAGARAYR